MKFQLSFENICTQETGMAVIVDSSQMRNNGSVLIKESIYAEILVGIWGARTEVLIEVTTEMTLECWLV